MVMVVWEGLIERFFLKDGSSYYFDSFGGPPDKFQLN